MMKPSLVGSHSPRIDCNVDNLGYSHKSNKNKNSLLVFPNLRKTKVEI